MSASEDSNVKSLSLTSLLAKESHLLREAALAIPHSFSACTFDLGYIRQAVYLCKTCTEMDGGKPKGICGACSVACHADHEQLELFPKRHFRCDCPTTHVPIACTLKKLAPGAQEPPNVENEYGQNFYGKFCRCGRDYDPNTETETMVQCLACEDWWHESCLHLRARPPPQSRAQSPSKIASSPSHPPTDLADDDEDEDDEDDDSPSLIPASSYESLICGKCVARIEPLRRWAGTPGIRMVVKGHGNRSISTKVASDSTFSSPTKAFLVGWEVIGEEEEQEEVPREETLSLKRSASPSNLQSEDSEPPTKRLKLENEDSTHHAQVQRKIICRAPQPNLIVQQVLKAVDKQASQMGMADDEAESTTSAVEGGGDIFLTEGWRERWCRCEDCLPGWKKYPFLLEEEETYTPPEDPDSTASFEELGLRALQTLPRDKALDSIRAFNDMRDGLLAYLRPFAQDGTVVKESHIKEFFETHKNAKASS